ncbi:MAG: hypothetical protein KAR39_06790 [Thermoplasmata archaeon]|nr:hypothetical protein [Thermoplasmata archaeon]
MKDPIRRFLDTTQQLRKDYKAIEFYLVAFKWETHWVNLSTRAIMSTQTPKRFRFSAKPPNLPDLLIEGALLPIDDIERILDVFKTGKFEWEKADISYQRIDHSGFGNPYSPTFRAYKRQDSLRLMNIDARCFILSGGESTVMASIGTEGFESLESRLASLDKPFGGMYDLVRTYTGSEDYKNAWCHSQLEIIAPIWLRFEQGSVLESENVLVKAMMREGCKLSKASVGIIEKEGGMVLRRDRQSLQIASRGKERQVFLKSEIPVTKLSNHVQLLLSYRGDSVDRLDLYRNRVSGRNPRMSVGSSVDPNLEDFRRALSGRAKKPSKGFEQAIVELMSFLGFTCIHVGAEDKANPDILAWALDPTVAFVIECTIAEPDLRHKATKFVARLRHIGSVAPGTRVVGVLATTLSRDLINPADLVRLKSDGILLIDKESSLELLELAEDGCGIGEVLQYLGDLMSRQQLSREILGR